MDLHISTDCGVMRKKVVHTHADFQVDAGVQDDLRIVSEAVALHNMKWTHVNDTHVSQGYGDEFISSCTCIIVVVIIWLVSTGAQECFDMMMVLLAGLY